MAAPKKHVANLGENELEASADVASTSMNEHLQLNDQGHEVEGVDRPSKETQVNFSKIGQKLAEEMEAQGYHPVIIFGSANSGKSTLLGSLFSYFQIDPTKGVGIYLGEPLLPVSTPQGRDAKDLAESFFYQSIQEFLDGNGHARTRARNPFFIPIIIRPQDLPEIRFAFMESNGEWYAPKKDTGKYFPELKEEINSILQHYQKGASFIHLAPFTQIDAWTTNNEEHDVDKEQINNASLALVGAFNSYERLRVFKNDDSHMFLITKWDATGKDELSERLEFVAVEDVEAVAANIYTKGFAAFNNLKLDIWQKSLMQYSSGIMSGRSIIRASPELKPILHRYPQTMWNWLYGNATRNNQEIGKAIVLLPKPIPPKKNFIDFLNEIVHKILN
ncbi:hypothetical protein MCEMSEM29_01932 [Methylophilaceae bacterium]